MMTNYNPYFGKCLLALMLAPAAWVLADTVYLDFPASVDQATRNQVKQVMQNEFSQAGANITVTDDPNQAASANRTVKFQDSFSDPKGDRWGDSGDGKTVNVYVKEFTGDPAVSGEFSTAARLGNGLGETAAHEVGHTYGCNHNNDKPPSKMTEGSQVGAKQRGDDNRLFNATDADLLKKNAGAKKIEPKPKDAKTTTTGVKARETPSPQNETCKKDGNMFFDAGLMVGGSMFGWFELGYMVESETGGPMFATRFTLEMFEPATAVVTLNDGWWVNWALRGVEAGPFGGMIFPLESYGHLALLGPRTADPALFGVAQMTWDVNLDTFPDVFLVLNADAKFASQRNGFHLVPLPGAAAAGCALLMALLARSLRRAGARGR